MTDREWIENLPKESNEKLIEDLEYFGCDSYYKDLWWCALNELERRFSQYDKDLSDFDQIARSISHVKATGKEDEVYDVVIMTKEEYERLKEAEKIPKKMYQYLDRRLDCGVPNGNVLWDCAKKFDIKVKAPWPEGKDGR